MPDPCPRCGDPLGDCIERAQDGRMGTTRFTSVDQTAFVGIIVACRLGQIAREFERLNNFLEGSEKNDH